MATEVNEIFGADGDLNVDGTRRYTRVFEVHFDDTVMDPHYVMTLAQLPAAQSPHPADNGSFCVAASAKQDTSRGNAGRKWVVTYKYSERQGTSIEDLFSGQGQDPELREVEVSWSTNQTQKYDEYDRNNKRITNSAGDAPLRPEPHFDAVALCTLNYFVRFKPANLMLLNNAINSSSFTLDGEYVDERCARIADIQVSKRQVVRGVIGRNITVQLAIGQPKTLKANSINNVGPSGISAGNITLGYWEPAFLDRGRREYDSTLNGGAGGLATIENDDGSIPEEPALLDGKGVALSKPVAQGSEVYRFYERYKILDFTLIRFPTI